MHYLIKAQTKPIQHKEAIDKKACDLLQQAKETSPKVPTK